MNLNDDYTQWYLWLKAKEEEKSIKNSDKGIQTNNVDNVMSILESISDNKTDIVKDLLNNEVNEELGDDGSTDLKYKKQKIHTER